MSEFLLDASALLAFLYNEPGGPSLRLLTSSRLWMSSVNLAEVLSKTYDHAASEIAVQAVLRDLGIRVLEFRAQHARWAARLRPATRNAGLSLGDRCCLATAIVHDFTVLTADRTWMTLALPVALDIQLIR